MFKTKAFVLLLGLMPLALQANTTEHFVVAPKCLVKKANLTDKIMAKKKSLSLLSVNDVGIEKLIAAKHERSVKPCGGFMDVTDDWQEFSAKTFTKDFKPSKKAKKFLATFVNPPQSDFANKEYSIQYEAQVNQLLKNVNSQNIWDYLTTLTSFENRNARQAKGKAAAEWIATQVKNMASANNRNDVTVYMIDTNNYVQPSVVAKIGESNDPGIVVGGHMDTLVMFNNRQPGGDDDGSGTATIMEAARTILSSGMKFKKPIYFIWYSAEEYGLIGSKQVVRNFRDKKIPVEAAIQFDMTGWSNQKDPTIWLLKDNVSANLTAFLEQLVTTYVKQPVKLTACGYGCSDHASWNSAGIPASAPFEAQFGKEDPYIHTTNDKMDVLSLSHMANFAKLAVAYTVEMAEPIN